MQKRTHFARILTRNGIDRCIAMITEAAGGPLGDLVEQDDADAIIIRAPDGDIVFQAIAKTPDSWLCRLHREVFTE